MEPHFWSVIVYVAPALAIVFLLFKRHGHKHEWVDHNLYPHSRKTRSDKPVY